MAHLDPAPMLYRVDRSTGTARFGHETHKQVDLLSSVFSFYYVAARPGKVTLARCGDEVSGTAISMMEPLRTESEADNIIDVALPAM